MVERGMRYLLDPKKTLIVRGPASIRLIEGQATALLAPLDSRKLIVLQERQLPIETSSAADFDIALGSSGSVLEIEGSTIPRSWNSALDALLELGLGTVMIVGATDVGKSTLSTFLANGLLKSKITPEIIDADIGQADIGPPTTVGCAVPTGYASSLVGMSPSALLFVGHTSPGQVQSKLIKCVKRLSDNAKQSLIIINTDGWVLDPEAVAYKVELIQTIRPDIVLGIEAGRELESVLSLTATRSMRVQASTTRFLRSQGDRRQLRTSSYRRFLDGGNVRIHSLRATHVKLPDGRSVISRAQAPQLGNLIVGFLDEENHLRQIGVLLTIENESLKIYSRTVDNFASIEVGYVKLSTGGVELGYLES
jgi:polynucleotide 5'-hydroxyl-kinase GRC3/NOL9